MIPMLRTASKRSQFSITSGHTKMCVGRFHLRIVENWDGRKPNSRFWMTVDAVMVFLCVLKTLKNSVDAITMTKFDVLSTFSKIISTIGIEVLIKNVFHLVRE